MARNRPTRISVRPAMGGEVHELGAAFVVWVYGRKVQLQIHYGPGYNRAKAILECVALWHATMEEV